mmetsp:Transcript_140198/g.349432  ORF Transcript_140198/g.349432 Transcript_140198/m.349432 type:complete len:167 (+) Transcript_140198:52-552(+)
MLLRGVTAKVARMFHGGAAAGAVLTAAGGGAPWAATTRCDGGGSSSMPSLPVSFQDLAPIGGSLSAGSVLGFCSGFAVKKAGKAAALIVGSIFCLQQGLSQLGYVQVNWPKVEKDLTQLLDVNKDGKVDAADMNQYYLNLLKILQHNTYSISGGFGAGFLYGVKKG